MWNTQAHVIRIKSSPQLILVQVSAKVVLMSSEHLYHCKCLSRLALKRLSYSLFRHSPPALMCNFTCRTLRLPCFLSVSLDRLCR